MRAKPLAQNLGLAAVTSLLFLGALELLARRFDEPAPAAAPVADYIWDWREKMEGDFYVIRSEAVGWPPWEEINGDGLRDRTHPVEKPPGRLRLVALGDSVTLGAATVDGSGLVMALEIGASFAVLGGFRGYLWVRPDAGRAGWLLRGDS